MGVELLPPCEENRIEALERLQILDTPPEPRFDQFTELLRLVFDMSLAYVSFVDRERVWFKSSLDGLTQRGRGTSLCSLTILDDEHTVIENTLLDPRLAEQPVVHEHGIRFYAGVPIKSACGQNIGSVCVADLLPRTLPKNGIEILKRISQMIQAELLRREQDQPRDTDLVTVCAWTNRIQDPAGWISPGEYLHRKGFNVSHGIAEDVIVEDGGLDPL